MQQQPMGMRQIAKLREEREAKQKNIQPQPKTDTIDITWWSVPTQQLQSLAEPCPVCETILPDLLGEKQPDPEETTTTSEDALSTASILSLIESGISRHIQHTGVIPGQIRIRPMALLLSGLGAYYIANNQMVHLVQDMALQSNKTIKCISNRNFLL